MSEEKPRSFISVRGIDAALERHLVIGQAQGILMERLGLSAERAFVFLSRVAHHTTTEVFDVAAELVRTRDVPTIGDGIKNV